MSFTDVLPGDGSEGQSAPILTSDDKLWGMFAHLSSLVALGLGGMAFLGPLIVWLIKKDQSKFVDDQGKEALNFQITMLLATLICFASIIAFIGIVLTPAVLVVNVVFSIVAGMEANKGKLYRYPFTLRLIK